MYKKKFLVVSLICVSISLIFFCECSRKEKIEIVSPKNNEQVDVKVLVQGKVSNYSGGNVYVLVRPMDSELWEVQRPPSEVNEHGKWHTLCEVQDGIFQDEYSELIAILIDAKLDEGDTLAKLPKDIIAKSSIIAVKN